jgi:hypothetical protein
MLSKIRFVVLSARKTDTFSKNYKFLGSPLQGLNDFVHIIDLLEVYRTSACRKLLSMYSDSMSSARIARIKVANVLLFQRGLMSSNLQSQLYTSLDSQAASQNRDRQAEKRLSVAKRLSKIDKASKII